MHSNIRVLGWAAGGLFALSLSACHLGSRMAFGNDQGGPTGSKQKQVQNKCRRMVFDTTNASAVQPLDEAGLVKVKIYPAVLSSKTKASQLASSKGRVIARVVNEGTGDWPGMALKAGSTSCWYVWEDDTGKLRSKFVALVGEDQHDDAVFDVDYPGSDHEHDESAWNPPARIGMAGGDVPVQLAVAGNSANTALIFNTGWTTCLINGCCRSRQ